MTVLFAVEETAKGIGSWTAIATVAALAGAVIGGAIVWVVNLFKIRKLGLESRQLEGQQISTLHEYRNKYREADRQLGQSMKDFVTELDTNPTNPDQLHPAREKVCAALDEAIPRFVDLFEFECHSHKGGQARTLSLIDYAAWEFRAWLRCISCINHPNVLRFLGKQPMRISKRTLHPLRIACESVKYRGEDKQILIDEINRVIEG